MLSVIYFVAIILVVSTTHLRSITTLQSPPSHLTNQINLFSLSHLRSIEKQNNYLNSQQQDSDENDDQDLHQRQKTLASSEIILQKLKEHPNTKGLFVQGQQAKNSDLIRATTIQIIKSDSQLQDQLAEDMFSKGPLGKLMNNSERKAMLQLALSNPAFFQSHASQGTLRKEMVELMKTDPILSKFYQANQKKVLANMS